jgi:hypothetical protein
LEGRGRGEGQQSPADSQRKASTLRRAARASSLDILWKGENPFQAFLEALLSLLCGSSFFFNAGNEISKLSLAGGRFVNLVFSFVLPFLAFSFFSYSFSFSFFFFFRRLFPAIRRSFDENLNDAFSFPRLWPYTLLSLLHTLALN